MSKLTLLRTINEMQSASLQWKREGLRVGFVPTMGALHEGHLSLVDLVRPRCERLVVSVFVNPAQFGPQEDFNRYPRDLEGDLRLLEARGTDAVFAPERDAIYPKDYATYVEVERLSSVYEGAIRPGHFRGVCTIVAKLFNIVQPDVVGFGQKDAQQVAVLKRMVGDLHFPIEFLVGATIRESDGLAMSSRNAYLTPEERPKATVLFRAMKKAEALIVSGERDAERIRKIMRDVLVEVPEFKPDYADIVQPETFERITEIHGRIFLIVAGRIGSVRLIDNLPVEAEQ